MLIAGGAGGKILTEMATFGDADV
ncbi:MAG: hypothetical protein FD151_310, partial [bacterium]